MYMDMYMYNMLHAMYMLHVPVHVHAVHVTVHVHVRTCADDEEDDAHRKLRRRALGCPHRQGAAGRIGRIGRIG